MRDLECRHIGGGIRDDRLRCDVELVVGASDEVEGHAQRIIRVCRGEEDVAVNLLEGAHNSGQRGHIECEGDWHHEFRICIDSDIRWNGDFYARQRRALIVPIYGKVVSDGVGVVQGDFALNDDFVLVGDEHIADADKVRITHGKDGGVNGAVGIHAPRALARNRGAVYQIHSGVHHRGFDLFGRPIGMRLHHQRCDASDVRRSHRGAAEGSALNACTHGCCKDVVARSCDFGLEARIGTARPARRRRIDGVSRHIAINDRADIVLRADRDRLSIGGL
ncbi:MAG: hypothetical protein BWY63_03201 [Chloroflexi bacterium ADurb.Bin360]|nr:MAG: hypothetical protein BWY63_03201 [Chloroflexi bacterium ADurb.Bin360]